MLEEVKLIGKRLKMIRVGKGLGQRDVAKALDLSQTHLSNMESGRSMISMTNLLKMRKLYGCTMNEIFSDLDRYELEEKTKISIDDLRKLTALLHKSKSLQ